MMSLNPKKCDLGAVCTHFQRTPAGQVIILFRLDLAPPLGTLRILQPIF